MLTINEEETKSITSILDAITRNKTTAVLIISIVANYTQFKYMQDLQRQVISVKDEQITIVEKQKTMFTELKRTNENIDTLTRY